MVAVRRKVADREDAQRLLDEWEDGSLDLPEFCAKHGVDGRSLQCWAMNLGRRQRDAQQLARVGLVELAVGAPAARASVYRLVVGDVAVEVDDAFREETLTRILRVVARC